MNFRAYEQFKVHTFSAIVINYFVAAFLSFYFQGTVPNFEGLFQAKWWWTASILGVSFITFFYLMAYCSQHIGITQTTVANKTTFVFPAIIGIYLFNESSHYLKLFGLVAALVAVYFSAKKAKEEEFLSVNYRNLGLIALLFFGGGLLDTLLAYSQNELLTPNEIPLFSGYIFLISALIGFLILSYQMVFKKIKINIPSVIGGITLGIPNYLSIFFFLSSMSYPYIGSSIAFPVSNMGIIVLASILGRILFKEQLTRNKQYAILFALAAILLVAFSPSN